MQKLAELCVRRPVLASVLTLALALVVLGFVSYFRLGVDRFPKVDFPTVSVTTTLPGAAPEELETEVTDKIEEAVNTISGIDELTSTTSEGVSQVIVQFILEKDTDIAAQEVRDRVNRILPDLPREIDPPTVEKFDPDAAPVLAIAVSAPRPGDHGVRGQEAATTHRDDRRCRAGVARRRAAAAGEHLAGSGEAKCVWANGGGRAADAAGAERPGAGRRGRAERAGPDAPDEG
jgi:HAE1 family hydrophobic/amphiphilic exporter-1